MYALHTTEPNTESYETEARMFKDVEALSLTITQGPTLMVVIQQP